MNVVSVEKVALGILADAVDRTVGTGFVHAAITRAASTLERADVSQADRAFRMLNPRECKKVRDTAIENAELFRDFGEYSDPIDELSPDPRLKDIRSKSAKLGSG
jgi:hypothetical protein